MPQGVERLLAPVLEPAPILSAIHQRRTSRRSFSRELRVPEKRLRVAVVYGGRSGEHEVSIQSARSVIAAIDPDQYEVVPIGVTHSGAWLAATPEALLAGESDPGQRVLPSADPDQRGLIPLAPAVASAAASAGIDVVFPLVHGTFGEDGSLQGLFELATVPYVGSGVLGSAVGMDKITMKTVFRAEGLPIVDYVPVARAMWESEPRSVLERIEDRLGYPCFVKPSNLGSSVGISKARDPGQLQAALDLAAEFGSRMLVEQAVDARELECGVLGNDGPEASVVGEIIPAREFYDYHAKYYDEATEFVIPAEIDQALQTRIQQLAIAAFTAIAASGMARVDFFLDRSRGTLYLNEINTIPGFTSMSVYPRLWAASGVPYPQLIDRLIRLALDRHQDEARNRTHYE
jgi:D-alanine-D-alanine ligase